MSESRYGDFSERRQDSVWDFLNRLMGALIVFAFIILIVCAFIPLRNQQRSEADKVKELTDQKAALADSLIRGTREIDALQHDPDYVATIARDKLDVMKSGETIIRFEETPPPHAKSK